MIEFLPRVIDEAPDRPELAGPDHPIRKVTRELASDPQAWSPERAAKVAQLFDGLAPEWHKRTSEGRLDPLRDALERGVVAAGTCLELGSGTGAGTEALAEAGFDAVVALDLSKEMLARAPARLGHRVRGDAATLPIAAGSADVIVLVNAFLFPKEIERVLARGGTLVWVSALGDRTPIYLSAEEVEAALPGEWMGVASDAGWGSWCVVRRAGEAALPGERGPR